MAENIHGVNITVIMRNFTCVTSGDTKVWFSYETPVAFQTPATGKVVSENAWSQTTGKHLNLISKDESQRIPHQEFIKQAVGLGLFDAALAAVTTQ